MDIKGKKIVFLGDSITEGAGTSSVENIYYNIISAKTGAICRGYGIGGTRIARNLKPSSEERFDRWFNSRVDDMDSDADMVVVFGGTNDYGHGDAPLGSIDSFDEFTFYGALNVLYTHLRNKYPAAKIYVITPAHRLNENSLLNENGVRNVAILSEYVNIIKEVALKYGFIIIDFYTELAINPEIEKQKKLFMPDGLHPSDSGSLMMADLIIEKLLLSN